ncbi:recombinase zinc beta ribbon domain-containing protein, partial [Caballeronia sp. INML2]|uniref:recombinase zinc beta ribbon domain-containing protein n=1 Tax=Caballeronia sp. INML2 TaxID=2921748 RepID=UPI003905F837
YKHRKPFEAWDVMLREHHDGYIDWAEFERNQEKLAANAYGKAGDVKSGRGGRALLAGLLACARCGRRLSVAYTGRIPQAVYRCNRFDMPPRCMTFGGSRIDAAIGEELLRVVEPLAIEAAQQAEQMHMDTLNEQRRIMELELQQARYEATLAERRYAACDPENRLIAAQLEKNWGSGIAPCTGLPGAPGDGGRTGGTGSHARLYEARRGSSRSVERAGRHHAHTSAVGSRIDR